MERNDSATKVEKANHEGGIEAAYKAFDAEVNQIASTSTYAEADQKILALTGELEKDGLLPGLSAYWALSQKPLMSGDMKFDRQELVDYVDGRKYDKTSYALGSALKADYSRMNDNAWSLIDFTGDNKLMNHIDLLKEIGNASELQTQSEKKDNAMKFADELKRDPALFDSLANMDGTGDSLSGWDIMNAQESFKLNDRMGKQVLTPEQIALIKNHNWDTLKDLAQAQDIRKEHLANVPSYEKHPWEIEDSAKPEDTEAAKLEAAALEKAKLKAVTEGVAGGVAGAAAMLGSVGASIGDAVGKAAGKIIADGLPPADQISKYDIEQGQGFDRIARDVLRREANRANGSEIRQFNEADVIALSSEIAKFNGMDREDMLKLDQKSLNIPPLNWTQISAT